MKDILEAIHKNETPKSSIKKTEDNLKAFDDIIHKINTENEHIDEHIQKLIERQLQAKQHNDKISSQIKAYKCLMESNFNKKLFVGAEKSEMRKVKEDISKFRKSYLKLKDFKSK